MKDAISSAARIGAILLMSVASSAVAKEAPWTFVASIGGITVGDPVRTSDGVTLPVHANVSGLETNSTKSTVMNSGMVCSGTPVKVVGKNIFLTIEATIPHGDFSARCPAASLGELPAGTYKVFYGDSKRDAKFLREVRVGL